MWIFAMSCFWRHHKIISVEVKYYAVFDKRFVIVLKVFLDYKMTLRSVVFLLSFGGSAWLDGFPYFLSHADDQVLYLPGKKTDFNCFFHFLLEGHELPHSIKFSQLRDLAKTDDPMVSLDGMEPEGEGKSSEFILQNRLKGSKKHSFGEWYHLISHTLLF